jgi:hypothetical protein
MQRREALKGFGTAVVGLVSLPSWANGWSKQKLQKASLLTTAEDSLLSEVVETIIPVTDTPGAKEIGVHKFVQTMVTDCYDQKAQETLTKGLAGVETMSKQTFGKAFAAGSAAQREHILEGMELSDNPTNKAFYSMVKGLTIQGYMSSEYVMTNLTHYEMIPGRFHGCVPVK